MASKPVLGYWNIRGLGHPVRFLLAYLEVDYEDKLYDEGGDRSGWFSVKPTMNIAFPNLPYWIDDKVRLSETRAILRHISRTYRPELLGKTPEDEAVIDMIDSFVGDFCDRGIVTVCYKHTEELHKQYKETMEPVKFGYLSNFLKDKPWIIGDDITYIDFFIYEVLHQVTTYDDKSLEKFPNLQAYKTRFESLPAIQKYMASPTYMKGPCFMQEAKFRL